MHRFQRDGAVQACIVGAIHFAHPPGTKRGHNFVGTEAGAGSKAQVRDYKVGVAAVHATSSTPPFGSIEQLDPRLDAIIPLNVTLERVAEGIEWAEGPVWDGQEGALLFSDIPRNGVYRWKQGSPVSLAIPRSGYTGQTPFAGREPGSNGLTFDREGRLVLTQHGDRRIVRREHDGSFTTLVDRYDGHRLNSPNDLVYRSTGDLYFTDPPYGLPGTFDDPAKELPFQGVFRLKADGDLELLATKLRAPNGLAFSPDERTLYVSNSDRERPIWMAYSLREDGSVSGSRQFADATPWALPGHGLPDGLKVDIHGHVFATGPHGVHVFAPDGTRLGHIHTGVPTGNVAWGEDGSVLFVAANHWMCRLQTLTRGARFR
jgi:gluconolactonase